MKPSKIPMTLERVGSEGKFFTDNMILKIMGCIVLAFIVSLLTMAQLSFYVTNLLALIVAIVLFVIQVYFYARKIVMKERQLKKILESSDFQTINTNRFYDIYDFMGNVALHSSGHISVFVEITRGSTLGMSNDRAKEYYRCIENFQNRILQLGYSYKEYNIETEDLTEEQDSMLEQLGSARQYSSNLAKNLELRFKYTLAFMKRSMRKEKWIYVIVSTETDTKQFYARMQQTVGILQDYHIQKVEIMNKKKVDNFAREFFNTKLFDPNLHQEELKTILEFEDYK